ncbi:hypothetical protein [Actinomadura sp. DC4]|uniref:hypothetical protein n=1 Tax=Actinomadura sp. DC4 TaxID=3055069 RepID=UPI0025B18006|nr:hypothetical protein [Actinomadura sp. DC4]MDN3354152.1 hypothetical protein [Actinomadura sp. DC4]
MTLLTTLAHLNAAQTGHAERLSTVRHRHLSDRPLVIVPLNLAGEAAAPLAAMVGTDRREPTLLTVPQPRNRGLRFGFFADLARIVMPYIEACRAQTEALPATRNREEQDIYLDAPQTIVPNRVALSYLGLLGRSTRFRRADGPNPVDASVPLLGQWLTFLAERAEHPDSAMLLPLTDLLRAQWATGQSPLEDANLAALLGWIDPPAGMSGLQAARVAEDPLQCPPAGPATDPGFDGVILNPAIERYEQAVNGGDPSAVQRAVAALSRELKTQLRPTWDLMWRGIDRLRAIGEAPSAETRWRFDRQEFTSFSAYVAGGGRPQPSRDRATTAAARLHRLERAQAAYDAQRALEDPFVMAELRTVGEAFGGTVVDREPTRTSASDKGRPMLRPRFTVRTDDPMRIEPGSPVVRPERPKDKVRISSVTQDDDAWLVVLEVTSGMGTPGKPRTEAVPERGDEVLYTHDPGWSSPREFPPIEETPWTHGGPPALNDSRDDGVEESW